MAYELGLACRWQHLRSWEWPAGGSTIGTENGLQWAAPYVLGMACRGQHGSKKLTLPEDEVLGVTITGRHWRMMAHLEVTNRSG